MPQETSATSLPAAAIAAEAHPARSEETDEFRCGRALAAVDDHS